VPSQPSQDDPLTCERRFSKGGVLTPCSFLVLCFLLVVVVIVVRALQWRPGLADLSVYPWLYLRDGRPLDAGERVAEVIVVGDVMLGRGAAEVTHPFREVGPWLGAADLALANLECVIVPQGMPCPAPVDDPNPAPGRYVLCAPSSAVGSLREAGFDVLALANNHALDLGPAGLAGTLSGLEAAGLATVGAGPDGEAALRPLVRQVAGVRLAFLALNLVPTPADASSAGRDAAGQDGDWTPAEWDRGQALDAIAAARAQSDAVVVSVHWGYEYETRVDPAQREIAQALLDAGTDLVVGHHPHVVQGCEIIPRSTGRLAARDRFVAYSLGNFIFDQGGEETRQGLALRVFFDGQGLRAAQALPVWAGLRPRLMALEEEAAIQLLARAQPPPRALGFACEGDGCERVEVGVPRALETGLFWSDEIDLTGDGVAERVRRIDEQVVVYQGGAEAWRSPPEWRVVDLALGDPNDDGRGELLLALWKPDDAGVSCSHPFIIGYREGMYRILWGGSAVSDPIHEVALGDVNGDGVQELIVLDAWGEGSQSAVSVWRWHGWGFSLIWRSEGGRYRDLTLMPAEAGEPATIVVAEEQY
jgi:poly-gamma-glutamate capsule biosynthesis protein CapA/YwtB (metallophosphatase superfamily)